MRISMPLLCCSLLLPSLRAQGDVVYYRFDAADAVAVLNHADGPQAAPRMGSTTWPASMLYAPGRFGSALQASGYVGLSGLVVHSGWSGSVHGDLTIACFLHNRLANNSSTYSPVAGQANWSLASGGSAGAGLQLHGWGGPDLNANLSLCSLPGWNHFAIVVDGSAGTATWYVNGAPLSTTPVAAAVNLGGGSELLVGTDYVTSCGGLYDIDEFRLLQRAATAGEVAVWATAPSATAVAFGAAAGLQLDAVGAPSVPNAAFAVRASGASGLVAFAAGSSYTVAGSAALPLPLAPGVLLRVQPQLTVLVPSVQGEAQLPLPVPGQPALLGVACHLQAFALDAQSALQASNALALGLGH